MVAARRCQSYFFIYRPSLVHSKNRFRWLLYFLVAIVLLKLGYNLGYRLVNGRNKPGEEARRGKSGAYRQAQGLRGVEVDPADSAEVAADTVTRAR